MERQDPRWRRIPGGVAEAILLGSVLVAPWLFGGVEWTVQAWLAMAVLAALVLWLVGHAVGRPSGHGTALAVVPFFALIAFGALQLTPVDRATQELLSPRGAELRDLLGASRPSEPVSLYPAGTRRDLALFLAAASAFFLGSRLFQGPLRRAWLYGLVAANGAALTLFGLAQKFTWNNLLYWTVPLRQGGAPFGPFVNQNNAGGYLNLCLAASLGLAVYLLARPRSRQGPPDSRRAGRGAEEAEWLSPEIPGEWAPVHGPAILRIREHVSSFLVSFDGTSLAVLTLVGLVAVGVLCSLSRGACLGMIGAAAVTLLVASRAGWLSRRLWAYGLVLLVALGVLAWVGMTETVHARLATILDEKCLAEHSLLPHWRNALGAAADFWRVGSGLGTYRFAYLPYEDHYAPGVFYHAENQYLESLVVAGIGGLAFLVAMMVSIGRAAWRLLPARRPEPDGEETGVPGKERRRADMARLSLGVAAWFALSGQCICAFFDFGLYIPANLLLFSLLCGVVAGRAAESQGESEPRGEKGKSRWLSAVVGLAMVPACLWSWHEMARAARIQVAMNRLPAEEQGRPGPELLSGGIEQLTDALAGCPDTVEGQQALADAWISLYRARAAEQLSREMPEQANKPELWEATAPEVLHFQAHRFAGRKDEDGLARLREEPVIRDHLLKALAHLVEARQSCPLVADTHLLIAALGALVSDPDEDEIHLQRARLLAGGNIWTHFECGLLESQAGRTERADADWQRSLALRPIYLDAILAIAKDRLDEPGTVARLLPDSPALLIDVARQHCAGEQQASARRAVLDRAEELITQTPSPEAQQRHFQGQLDAFRGRREQAIASLVRAVELRPGELEWRYELAALLCDSGRLKEAHNHIRLCARAAPKNAAYRALLDRVVQAQLIHPSGESRATR